MAKISLKKDTEIVGLFDINISKVDNTVYISNKRINDPGAVNSFALYADEEGRIKSAGIELTYDPEECVLKSPVIKTNQFITDCVDTNSLNSDTIFTAKLTSTDIESNHITSENITVDVLTVNHYLDIDSISVNNTFNKCLFFLDNDHDKFARMHYDDVSGGNMLVLLTKRKDGTDGCALGIDESQRVRIIDGVLNLKSKRVIKSPIGSKGDCEGDIVINDGYIYYCKKSYNGFSKIWIRTKFTETDWNT
jgi:hypothetical protein